MNVFVCSTVYHIYVSLLLQNLNKEKCIFLLSSHDREMHNLFIDLQNKLELIENVHCAIINNRSKLLDTLLIEKIKEIKIKKRINSYGTGSFYLFGWNQYQLYRTNQMAFRNSDKVVLVEEGANSYLVEKPAKIKTFILKMLNLSLNVNREDKIKSVLVQYPEQYKEIQLRKKVKLDIQQLEEQLEEKNRDEIISLFLESKTLNELMQIKLGKETSKSILILTQPLSEDGFETEQSKIEKYKKIVIEHDEYVIFLKKHPRDRTTYNFTGVIYIEKNIPSELFGLMGITFDKAVGVCTSAIFNASADIKINLEEDYFDKKDRVLNEGG